MLLVGLDREALQILYSLPYRYENTDRRGAELRHLADHKELVIEQEATIEWCLKEWIRYPAAIMPDELQDH